MTNRAIDLTPRAAALLVGFGYLGILVFNTIALSLVDGLIVAGDPAAMAGNIASAGTSFRMGIAAWIVVLALDTLIAWALYRFLEPAGRRLSLLAAWFRLLFVAVAAGSVISLLSAAQLLGTASEAAAFGRNQLDALAMLAVAPYEFGFNVAFVFFGLHILCVGWLILRTDVMPRALGMLLVIAAAGYGIDSFASIVSPGYAANPALFLVFVAVPGLVGEYAMALWLLARGGRDRELMQLTSEAA